MGPKRMVALPSLTRGHIRRHNRYNGLLGGLHWKMKGDVIGAAILPPQSVTL